MGGTRAEGGLFFATRPRAANVRKAKRVSGEEEITEGGVRGPNLRDKGSGAQRGRKPA